MYGELDLIKTTQGAEIPAIPIVIQNPRKIAVLRLPTSEEISAYTTTIRSVTQNMGRRMSEEQTVTNDKAERKFFDAIRLDPTGDEFDSAEVQRAVEIVLQSRVKGCEREGDNFIVTVVTSWGNTVHTCRIPTTRELQTYREGLFKTRSLAHGIEEKRFPPEVPSRLYDAIVQSVEGYAPQFNVPSGTVNGNRHAYEGAELKQFLPMIPPHHKRHVAGEISSQMYELDPQLDPS